MGWARLMLAARDRTASFITKFAVHATATFATLQDF